MAEFADYIEPVNSHVPTRNACKPWCATAVGLWTIKCSWPLCSECAACSSSPPPPLDVPLQFRTLDDLIALSLPRRINLPRIAQPSLNRSTYRRDERTRLSTARILDALPPAPPLPNLTRWHVTTQDRLLHHLRALWGGKSPRVGVDLGSHASHGAYVNMSDALLFLDAFHAPNTLIVALDLYEDFSFDLARRMEHNEPYASMDGVEKLSLALAIDCCQDDGRKNFGGPARIHTSCCADLWCHYGDIERQRGKDHLCRMTRMRLGLVPSEPWLPPSSHPLEAIERFASNGTLSSARTPHYIVKTITLETLWKRWLHSRRIDFLKVDIDMPWTNMGGLETLLSKKAIAVMTVEIDGSWGQVLHDWGITTLDQLAWVARLHGYITYLKIPCKARKGRGSLEAGSWRWDWSARKYRVAESTHGSFAAWLHPLAAPGAPFVPSQYHARRPNGVQDAVLVDADDESLRELEERCASDCAAAGS